LEHIPPSLIAALLDALKSRQNAHAIQIHRVDLRDHRDFDNDPYGFLDPSRQFDAESDADSRGNGMTLSDWTMLLAEHPHWGLRVGEFTDGRPHLMPSTVPVSAQRVVADSLVLRSATTVASPDTRGV
jgi:hypothetical protein